MPIPTSGPFTSETVRSEWQLGLPMTSEQLRVAAGEGLPFTSESLRGRSYFVSAYHSVPSLSQHELVFDSYATAAVSGSTVTPVGGRAPYSYVWSVTSGDNSMGCTGGATPTFSYSGSTPFSATTYWNCTVTDATGVQRATGNLEVTLSASNEI